MSPLDELLRGWITPVMAGAGFSRKGRTYRLLGRGPGTAVVHVLLQGSLGDGNVRFAVGQGVTFPALMAFRSSLGDPAAPVDLEHCFRMKEVLPPVAHWAGPADPYNSPWIDPIWVLRPGEPVAPCGEALASLLELEAVPLLQKLLDPANMLRHIREDPDRLIYATSNRVLDEILLRVDDAPTGEMYALLDNVTGLPKGEKLTAWLRERLEARAAAGV